MIARPDAKAFEVHDRKILKAAQAMLDQEVSPKKMADAVLLNRQINMYTMPHRRSWDV